MANLPMELSVEVDRDIAIEISTGFGPGHRPTMHAAIPITVEQLGEAIERIKEVYNQLKAAKKCTNCGTIYAKEENDCPNCESKEWK